MGSGYETKPQVSRSKVIIISIICVIMGGLVMAGIIGAANGSIFPAKDGDGLVGNQNEQRQIYHAEAGDSVAVGEAVSPSVVFINNIVNAGNFMSNTTQEVLTGTGSGVIYSEDGYIITNNHVVAGANKINVKLYDGTTYVAEVIGTDPRTDLAVIKIDANNLVPAKLGNSDDLVIGEMAVAIGNPGGEEFTNSLTQGVISGLNRIIETDDGLQLTLVQTDAAINPGNSGGALCNGNGEVIGINTVKITIPGFEGMGFAIPSNTVTKICDELIASGKIARPALGVGIYADITKEIARYNNLSIEYGVLIAPLEGSGAEKAGLQTYDIIIAVDGEKIETSSQLQERIFAKNIGDKVTVTVQRGSETKDFTIILGELEQ